MALFGGKMNALKDLINIINRLDASYHPSIGSQAEPETITRERLVQWLKENQVSALRNLINNAADCLFICPFIRHTSQAYSLLSPLALPPYGLTYIRYYWCILFMQQDRHKHYFVYLMDSLDVMLQA